MIADGGTDHLGELARERPLPSLGHLRRKDPILEHQVVRDGHRHDVQHRHLGQHDGVEQARLGGLQFAAVAAAAFRVEEQVVRLEQFRDERLQRDQVGRIARASPDRNRTGDVLVQQAERTAEQVDARGDDRRPQVEVLEINSSTR